MNQADKNTDRFLSMLFEPTDIIDFRLIESWDTESGKRGKDRTPGRHWIRRKDWHKLLPEFQRSNSKDNKTV